MPEPLLLVLGWGLLGQAVARAATDAGFDYRYVTTSPVTDRHRGWRVDIARAEPPAAVFDGVTHVVHTKALTSVAKCERDPGAARALNASLVADVVHWAGRHGLPVVYPSTDWVFDGSRGDYAETDETGPLNVYGETKLLGERPVLAGGGLVLRGAFVGARPDGRPGLKELLHAEQGPRVGRPRLSNPLWVGDYAAFLVRLALAGVRGVVHLGSSTHTSWHEFCSEARRALRGTDDVLEAPLDGIARPANTVLSTERASRLLSTCMPTAEEVRRRFVECDAVTPGPR